MKILHTKFYCFPKILKLIINTYRLKKQPKVFKALHRATIKFTDRLMNSKIILVQLYLVSAFLDVVHSPTRNQKRNFLVDLGKNCKPTSQQSA